MALYKFQCECSTFEDIVPMGTEEAECPKCGGIARRIKEYSTNFKLKGGGWYNDGYTNSVDKELQRELDLNRRIHDKTENTVVEGDKSGRIL